MRAIHEKEIRHHGHSPDPRFVAHVDINPLDAADKSQMDRVTNIEGTGHLHPAGAKLNLQGQQVFFGQAVSPQDFAWARSHPNIKINFAVEMYEGRRVDFYNGKGFIASVSWDQFTKSK